MLRCFCSQPVRSWTRLKSIHNKLMATKHEKKVNDDRVFDFGIGHPSHSLNLPKKLVSECVHKLLDEKNEKDYKEATDYGLCEGSWWFRSNLADWLNKLNAMNKGKHDKQNEQVYGSKMVLTTGASQSMELLLIHLKRLKNKTNANRKNIVLCEDPSYYLFPDIVETANCKILPIPFQNNRLDFDYLENILKVHGNDIICFYVIPSHHNPLGHSYCIEDKLKLIHMCHQYKLHLIADEVYSLLSFDANTMMIPFMSCIEESLYKNDEKEIEYFCHSVSSFSKILGPGFRVGWIYSNNEKVLKVITNHGSIKSGGCMNQFVPSLLTYLLDQEQDDGDKNMTNHLIKVRNQLAVNCKALCDTIRKYDTQKIIKFVDPKGGYFMWMELPLDKMKLLRDKKNNVKYFDGMKLSSSFGPISKNIQFVENEKNRDQKLYFEKCVRFCFAYLSEQEIKEGAKAFVELLNE